MIFRLFGYKGEPAMDVSGHKSKYYALAAFFSGALMFIAVILPDLISKNGILLFSSDYLEQSIPFTYTIYDHLHNFTFGWDMSTGLGSDFLTSYAFYGLFSPFTLLYLPLPRDILIYAMPYVTAIKYGVGTLFAYFFIKRYVKSPSFAVIGAMTYMFSSFTAYNEIFHFTDAIALFPLMLIALEELCDNGRKGVFALTVTLLALTNYYFFFGQAVFLIIYFLCRYAGKDMRGFLKKLGFTALEAVIGVMLACFMLLPVAYALLNSPKATGTIGVSDMFFFDSIFKYLHIIQSVFSVPDGFGLVTLFPETSTSYPYGMLMTSVAGYIPFFSAAGVISYFFAKRKMTREKVLMTVCVVFALIPVLNQSFSGFNSAYYARWYYMPILIGSMISVRSLEEKISFRPGIITCGAVLSALLIFRIFFAETLISKLSVPSAIFSSLLGFINIGVAAISLLVLIAALKTKRNNEFIPKLFIYSYICIYMTFGIMTYFNVTNFTFNDKSDVENRIAMFGFNTEKTDIISSYDRTDLPAQPVNYNLIWGYTGVAHFNSLHDPGFKEFFDACGMKYPGIDNISVKTRELCDLVSVKYSLSSDPDPDTEKYTDFDVVGDFGVYKILENRNYIPLGFTYDMALSRAEYDRIKTTEEKQRSYMKYLIVDDPDEFSDILSHGTYSPITDDEYSALIERHRAECAYDTSYSAEGISSSISLAKENIVFFSVSYNKSWKAYVDGEETQVLKVNNGLIGVRVHDGTHSIDLRYSTPLLSAGIAVSACGAVLFILYIGYFIIYANKLHKPHIKK